MSSFNGDVNLWTHYENLSQNFHSQIEIDKKCSIDAKKRIGSQSTMAQVFRIDVNSDIKNDRVDVGIDIPVAVKVLPITNENSYKQIENEILIAKLASEFSIKSDREGKNKYFPIVYDFLLCKDTKFYNTSGDIPYFEKSRRFQEYEFLLNLSKDEKIIKKIMNFKKRFIDAEITAKKFFPNQEIHFSGKVESFLLFSELANCDMKYYLTHNNLTDNELKYLIRETLLAISDLHTKLNIVHADLHLGNILILTGKYPRVLIHDFGKSHFSDFISEHDRKDDLTHFIGHFIDAFEMKPLSQNIKDYLDKILDIVNDSKEKFIITEILSNV